MFKTMFMSINGGGGVVSLVFKEQKLDNASLYFLQLLYSILVLVNFLGCLW